MSRILANNLLCYRFTAKSACFSIILTITASCSSIIEPMGVIQSVIIEPSNEPLEQPSTPEPMSDWVDETDDVENASHCRTSSDTHYRKKAVILGFSIGSRRDALDLKSIHTHYPSQLLSNLDSGQLLVVNNVDRTLPKFRTSSGITKDEIRSIIKGFAETYSSQFLITGEIIDTGFEAEKRTLAGYFSLDNLINVISNHNIRQFVVKITMYDGFNGEIIDSHRFSGQAYDRRSLKKKPQLFSQQFINTDYGQLIHNAINEQSIWIENNIRCLPLRTQIVAHDSNGVTLNAGSEANISTGDTFTIMAKSQHRQKFSNNIIDSFNPSGQVIVKSVYSHGAYAEFSRQSPKHRLVKGDLVESQ